MVFGAMVRVIFAVALGLTVFLLGFEARADEACFPECRAGYVCSPQGQCVSACNPACEPGQTCAAGGTCHESPVTSQPATAQQPATQAATVQPAAPSPPVAGPQERGVVQLQGGFIYQFLDTESAEVVGASGFQLSALIFPSEHAYFRASAGHGDLWR